MEYLKSQLMAHFGDDIEIASMEGGGFYPRFHVEVDVLTQSKRLSLFLKAMKPMRPERQEAEYYAYTHVLPLLEIRTPHLFGCFPDIEYPTQWLILERIEGCWSQRKHEREVLDIFQGIGYLHGKGITYPPAVDPGVRDFEFPSTKDEEKFSEMRTLLEEYAVELSLDKQVVEGFDRNLEYLRESQKTWIHGDNDVSNMLMCADGLCIIDWETFSWASPALDLGDLVQRVTLGKREKKHIDAYCRGFVSASGKKINPDQVNEWMDQGVFYDGVQGLTHYCERRINDKTWDGKDWFDSWGLPRVRRINELIGRNNHSNLCLPLSLITSSIALPPPSW